MTLFLCDNSDAEFIYSFTNHLLSTYNLPGAVLRGEITKLLSLPSNDRIDMWISGNQAV